MRREANRNHVHTSVLFVFCREFRCRLTEVTLAWRRLGLEVGRDSLPNARATAVWRTPTIDSVSRRRRNFSSVVHKFWEVSSDFVATAADLPCFISATFFFLVYQPGSTDADGAGAEHICN